jgi:hypothetical protein
MAVKIHHKGIDGFALIRQRVAVDMLGFNVHKIYIKYILIACKPQGPHAAFCPNCRRTSV